VVRWLTSAEVQKKLFLSHGYPPTLSEIYEDESLISAEPLLPLVHAALDHAVLRPETPLYAQLSDLLQRRLSNLFTTNETVDQAMTGLQQQSTLLMQAAAGNEN
jgi:multiple sugar transport system substrate-binding protein